MAFVRKSFGSSFRSSKETTNFSMGTGVTVRREYDKEKMAKVQSPEEGKKIQEEHMHNVSIALRKLKKVASREGVVAEQKRDRFFIPKSILNRQKKMNAKRRQKMAARKARY